MSVIGHLANATLIDRFALAGALVDPSRPFPAATHAKVWRRKALENKETCAKEGYSSGQSPVGDFTVGKTTMPIGWLKPSPPPLRLK